MRKQILFISNLYPNPLFPTMAAYNRQQIEALREYFSIEVVSPIPWPLLLKHKFAQPYREENGIIIHHPTYYYTPRILREMYGKYFYYSIKTVATKLLEQKQFDLIFSSWLYPDSWAAAKLARQYNLPLFVKVHGSDVNRLIPGTTIARRSLEVAHQAEKVICVSRALKERLIGLGIPEKTLEILYNGVDRTIFYPMNRYDVQRQLKVDPDEFLVLYVGNLKKEKGLGELIAAFKTISATVTSSSRLVIIGSGAYKATAEQLVSSHGLLNKVQFLGSQSLETIALWMNAASVLCLPSYMEGVPNVVLEALACGTPVVATNVGGIPELCGSGKRIYLIPPRNSESLAKILLLLVNKIHEPTKDNHSLSWEQNALGLYTIFMGQV